jgi:hypothetical protein
MSRDVSWHGLRCAGLTLSVVAAALAFTVLPTAAIAATRSKTLVCSQHIQGRSGRNVFFVPSMSATGTSCAVGRTVTKAFHVCRLKSGDAGPDVRCHGKVLGYRCSQKNRNVDYALVPDPSDPGDPSKSKVDKARGGYTAMMLCIRRGAAIRSVFHQDFDSSAPASAG